ncbi:MAG: glycosyltransferase [Pseudomonadota bacterium]
MKNILMICYAVDAVGGGSAVGVWALEALKEQGYQVTVLVPREPDLKATAEAFGTNFGQADFNWIAMPAVVQRLLSVSPIPLALLQQHLMARHAQKLIGRNRYDVIVSMIGEVEVGAHAIQYVHYPWAKYPRPDADYKWYHFKPLLLLYRSTCAKISGYKRESAARNETLVNSAWTKQFYADWYQASARVLYPPVPGGFPDVSPENRDLAFVSLGRLAPEKELEKTIAILERVRELGFDVKYRIVGVASMEAYAESLYELAKDKGDWISFHLSTPRDEMVRLVAACRFGIHGMVGEHFGIAPAELQRAGCITFVPHDGGPIEIVDGDERVIYRSVEEGAEKIARVLGDRNLEKAIRRDVAERAERFSEERFMAEFRSIIKGFAA